MKKCNHPIPIQHFHLLDDPSSPGTPRLGAVCPSCQQSVTIAKMWHGQPPTGPIRCPANIDGVAQLTEASIPRRNTHVWVPDHNPGPDQEGFYLWFYCILNALEGRITERESSMDWDTCMCAKIDVAFDYARWLLPRLDIEASGMGLYELHDNLDNAMAQLEIEIIEPKHYRTLAEACGLVLFQE